MRIYRGGWVFISIANHTEPVIHVQLSLIPFSRLAQSPWDASWRAARSESEGLTEFVS